MPGRLEFEVEIDNDAEEHVKDLEFGLVMDFGGCEQPDGEESRRTSLPVQLDRAESHMQADIGNDTAPSVTNLANKSLDVPDEPTLDDAIIQQLQPETHQSHQLKLTLLDIYNSHVDRRLETKAVVFDRGLLELKKVSILHAHVYTNKRAC